MRSIRKLGIAAALAWAVSMGQTVAAETISVYKSSTCQCCEKWIEHLRKSGFEVRSTDTEKMNEVKGRFGVPMEMRSCHTAVVNGYVIEGHVPVSDIQRLLKERPKVAGLAAPGMPPGSPGMEGPTPEPYAVMSFAKDGTSALFAKH